MSLIKPPVLPVWADSGDKVQPSDTELPVGWPLSNTPPARQRWNWLLNYLMNGVRYFSRRGLPDYDAAETYVTGDTIIGDDGKTYRSLQDANTANTPSTSPLWWERWGYRKSELTAELNAHDYKDSCRVATTANLASLSGLLTVDGVVLVANDRILVKDQTTASQNGIYVAAAGAWSRATDADANTELTASMFVPIEEGTTNQDTLWLLKNDGPITIGVSSLVFQWAGGMYAPAPSALDNSTRVATTAYANLTAPVVGAMRNAKMVVVAASATATFTADELVMSTALGGAVVKYPSFNKTVNLATTGAGGMDTGSAPVSGFVALYAIYNPVTGTAALLAVNTTSAVAPPVYGGANMPAGYTASALVSVWATTAAGLLAIGVQRDRKVSFPGIGVMSGGVAVSYTSVSLSAAVPKNAVEASGWAHCITNTAGGGVIYIAADGSGSGSGINQIGGGGTNNSGFIGGWDVCLSAVQTLYYSTSSLSTSDITVSSYTF